MSLRASASSFVPNQPFPMDKFSPRIFLDYKMSESIRLKKSIYHKNTYRGIGNCFSTSMGKF